MATKPKTMRGVSSVTRKGVVYWYARIGDKKTYCGKGDKGFQIAVAAKGKDLAKGYENKEIRVGLKVTRPEFKTIRDLANWYMQLPSVQGLKSYYRKSVATSHLLQHLGDRQLNESETDDQESYRMKRREEKSENSTINFEIQTLRCFFKEAWRRKKIPADMVPGKFVKINDLAPRRRVTAEEYKLLLEQAQTQDFRDFLICGWESAMRSSEVGKLTASQVHLGVRHISGQTVDFIDLGIFDTKTGARRTVPVSPILKKVLQRRLEGLGPDDYVFTFNGKRVYTADVTNRMQSLCEKCGIPYGDKIRNAKGDKIGIVYHCFRVSRTSAWVEAGFNDELIRRATGHRSLEAYQQYVRLDPAAVMRLVGMESKTDNFGTKTAKTVAV
jgi:integrase